MELKFLNFLIMGDNTTAGSNCTFMELKLHTESGINAGIQF